MTKEIEYEASAKRAPEPLDLVQRFVNTQNRIRGYDLFGSPEDARRWLFEAGYVSVDALGEVEFRRLCAIRESLRTILAAHTLRATKDSERATGELNRLCATVALRSDFDPQGRPRLVAISEGLDRFVGDLFIAAIQFQYTGLWKRLKACANEDCRWVFYDHSKNLSGNWCVMEICGSRAKMRKYRQRHN